MQDMFLADKSGKKYFVWKLIPSRPNFAQDMTKEEALVMMQHGAYWADKVEKGVAILFGPVFDPKGVWGLGVVEVENEGQVRSLAANDPAVKSGLQKMEIYPFHATLRK